MTIDEKEVYTTKEVAKLLKISLPTVKRMLKDRRLPSTRIGRQHRFLGRDLLTILESREDLRQPSPEPRPDFVLSDSARLPSPAVAAERPRIGEPEYVRSLTAIERRQRLYVLGKEVTKDIYAENGALIIPKGTVVNDDVVILARSNRKMMDLFTSLEHEA